MIELDQPGQWVQDLPLGEQQWLADADVHLLVPLVSGNGFVGAMALGEKLNGLPFSHDDQSLLAPAGAALALQIELLSQRTAPAGTPPLPPETREPREAEEPALVCAACSFVSGTDRGRCDRCGGAVTPGRLPALLAGKFRLERELGRGGMGVVYVAFDTALERRVAIKTLPQVAVAESVRLRREARAMAGFTHPNLALIFGIESWRGVPALVMEFLEGGTLANRLNRGPLTPGEVELLAHELAGAIALIHDAGMLHRDIKPSNIAYTSTGQPKLLDFGLAQIIVAATPREFAAGTAPAAASWLAGSDLTTVDRIGNFAGTPAYMAPEATRGEALDGASDLWSFGLVLFECATGERPRTATAHAAVTRDWATELLARAPQCPPHLRELIADLLAADKDHRPPSAQSVRARLREHATLRVA